jgi:para-nitrobenzyl esterase
MVEPARFAAGALADQRVPSWEFRFAYVPTFKRAAIKAGAPHASEIAFVFDTVREKYGRDASPEDERMAKAVNGYWAAFAKSGDPNRPGQPAWPRYSTGQDVLMTFSASGVPAAGKDPWKPRLDLVEALAQGR